METVAVYSERPVRTYGLKVEEDYVLLSVPCPTGREEVFLGVVESLDPAPELAVAGAVAGQGGLELAVCLPRADAYRVGQALAYTALKLASPPAPVCLIHLQGPHFGDRYGIAAEAMNGLAEAAVTPLMLVGLVHSLYVVVAPGEAKRALKGLGERFAAPA